MMTKKHFNAIAAILKEVASKSKETANSYMNKEIVALSIHNEVSVRLCTYFATINDRFDREKFLDACGVNE